MIPARSSRRFGRETKLLSVTAENEIQHENVGQLIDHLQKGDLLVVNRSATLPSSFKGYLERTGEIFEIRLAAFQGPSASDLSRWMAFAFGAGDWHLTTEERGAPPTLQEGDRFVINESLSMKIERVELSRLLHVKFEGVQSLSAMFRSGQPIQYSYLNEELRNWDQQTIFAGAPVSVEPPSASFPFTWSLVEEMMKKGIEFATLLHSAGISSTGVPQLDALLPLPEWFEIPEQTVEKFNRARASGRDVIAVGTSVLRAMESSWNGAGISATHGVTSLKIQPASKIRTATGIITGMHDVGASHMNILDSFCSTAVIRSAYREAEERQYRGHEFGDIAFLNCRNAV